ncbi:MAG TPA: transposase [Firmicutes bacterium]|nr:transposase [Bacillota bacterium]
MPIIFFGSADYPYFYVLKGEISGYFRSESATIPAGRKRELLAHFPVRRLRSAHRKLGRPRKEPYPNQLAPRHRVDNIAKDLPESAWETITWREGSKGLLTKQFAFMRVQRTTDRRGTGPIGWLICERPLPGHEGDWKWYFSNLPGDTSHERLVPLAPRRHEIERYYEDAKDELGLDH